MYAIGGSEGQVPLDSSQCYMIIFVWIILSFILSQYNNYIFAKRQAFQVECFLLLSCMIFKEVFNTFLERLRNEFSPAIRN